MYRRFVQFVEENALITKDDNLVVGVSGGADSVCLLSLLCKYREEIPFSITVVHVNHMIRQEAVDDAAYVESLCKEKNLPYVLKEMDVNMLAKKWGMSTEEAGRKVRYDAFSEVLGNKDGKIVVAHNQNDCAETVLFHLFRGSGATGLAGIHTKNGKIIRPLLCFSREEIENYLKENHINYCIDKTNLTDDYTRNKIRNHILPYVEKEIATGSISHIYSAANLLKEQEEFVNEQVKSEYQNVVLVNADNSECQIDKAKFETLHSYMKKKILLNALEQLAGCKKDITRKHVESVLGLFNKEGMKFIDLPYGLYAKSGYHKVCICKRKDKENEEVVIRTLDEAKDFSYRIFSDKIPDTIPEKTYTKWFDYDKINGTLMIRTKSEGDFLMVQDGQHKKSLNRYFIDEKIPKDKRGEILLLADGAHIVWVIGKRISDYYKVDKNTKKIIEIHYGGGQ